MSKLSHVKRILGVHVEAVDPPRVLWLYVLAWAGCIYVAIPLARGIQTTVASTIGAVAFTLGTLGVLAAALTGILVVAAGDRRPGRARRLAVLVAVPVLFGVVALRLRASPEEALHLVQYGVLAVLVLRAVGSTFRDRTAYLTAAAFCVLIGAGDEVVQWLMPNRYFDFRDIGLNVLGAAGVLVWIRFGVDPQYLTGWSEAGSRRMRRAWLAVGVVALLLFANTPAVVEAYTSVVVPMRYLRDGNSAMAEYGTVQTITADMPAERGGGGGDGSLRVTWKTRLETEEAAASDADRCGELSRLQRRVVAGSEGEGEGPRRGKDEFAYELHVHTRVLAEARRLLVDPEDSSHAAVLARAALGEDAILREAYPRTMELSGVGLSAEERSAYFALAGSTRYESPVDIRLITSSRQIWAIRLVALAVVVLLLLEVRLLHVERRKGSGQRVTSNSSSV